ncbi:acyltransferase domain-containing protein [Nocardia suismassiliense]|uniref:acyltransferase domain-containing protein n=1 Tax=Nocardia suismassiliense TaxID=2077092 RepID=UPI00131F4282|nr:acyltransferase domain-containing protein [Nocardia suismassiliense]
MDNRISTNVALFPGQGGFDGMALANAAKRHPEVSAVLAEVDTVPLAEVGRSLSSAVLREEPPTLGRLLADEPWVSQLAIYATSVAVYRVLHAAGLRPSIHMGHSLGEIAALVSAGVYSVADGARIIWHRVQAVGELDLPDSYMAAVGADPHKTRTLVELVENADLAVAVENHARQTVVSGPQDAMDALRGLTTAIGISFVRLESPAPFHSPLLRPAGLGLAARIRDIPANPPQTEVYSPILNRSYTADDDIAELLASHLVAPVRFAEGVRTLYARGVRGFVECGALGTLCKFTAKTLETDPHTAVPALPAGATEVALLRLRAVGLLGAGAVHPDFDTFWDLHGTEIIAHVRRTFENGHTAVLPDRDPVSVPEPVAPQPVAATNGAHAANGAHAGNGVAATDDARADHGEPARDEVAGTLRTIYAEALEYPIEVFTDEVELEAELGIDSVKQIELLNRVSEQYGLQPRTDGFRLADYDTMGKVIGYTMTRLSDRESVDV